MPQATRAVLLALTITSTLACAVAFAAEKDSEAKKLWIGTASTSITPDQPVALAGQMRERIARTVESPVTANVVVLQSRQGDQALETAVMVSCDLVAVPDPLIALTRQEIQQRLPELDVKKVIFNATHTHTAPCIRPRLETHLPPGVMSVESYRKFFAQRVADAVEKSWKSQKPGGVSWGLGHAVVAHNRRVVFADGSAVMYGDVKSDQFRKLEGPEDHGVEVLFFWNEDRKLIATAVNVACPAQAFGNREAVNADYWHPVRETLKEKYGKDLCVLGWIGAAGDQSPHLRVPSVPRKRAEERMRDLRGLNTLQEIARRVTRAVDDVYEVAKSEIHYDSPLIHVVKTVKLPQRLVTEKEYQEAKTSAAALKNRPDLAKKMLWHTRVIDKYESQKKNSSYEMELHVVRLGDVAIATNSFELFTDYGIQIKARSKALQTFVIQLTGLANGGAYLPTTEAVHGGGYSAIIQSNMVGPKGGQILVDRTVEEVNRLWKETKSN